MELPHQWEIHRAQGPCSAVVRREAHTPGQKGCGRAAGLTGRPEWKRKPLGNQSVPPVSLGLSLGDGHGPRGATESTGHHTLPGTHHLGGPTVGAEGTVCIPRQTHGRTTGHAWCRVTVTSHPVRGLHQHLPTPDTCGPRPPGPSRALPQPLAPRTFQGLTQPLPAEPCRAYQRPLIHDRQGRWSQAKVTRPPQRAGAARPWGFRGCAPVPGRQEQPWPSPRSPVMAAARRALGRLRPVGSHCCQASAGTVPASRLPPCSALPVPPQAPPWRQRHRLRSPSPTPSGKGPPPVGRCASFGALNSDPPQFQHQP